MGKLCPGHPNDMAVAVGIYDLVYLTCGDGSGSFANVVEPHGEQFVAPYDYNWDPSFGNETTHLVTDLFVWEAGPTLYALRLASTYVSEAVWLQPAGNDLESGPGRTISTLRGGDRFAEMRAHPLQHDDSSWSRIVFTGSPGIGVAK